MTASQSDFAGKLAVAADRVANRLATCLPVETGDRGERELAAAMRYAVLNGGKRLRAFLALEVAALFETDGSRPHNAGAERVAAAVECLHSYSLVHDDLPCMDDDDLRRGLPTVHKAWDEATAVLAGDALQALAFEILADPATHPDSDVRARLALRLAQASGHGGMIGGQAIDLAVENAETPLTGRQVKRLQSLKTGALIEFAAEAGAIIAKAPEADITRIRAYAQALGEAFQIADDLLDIIGTEAEVGKRVGKDSGAGKATFVDIFGASAARARATVLVTEAAQHLAPYGTRATRLVEAAQFAVDRRS